MRKQRYTSFDRYKKIVEGTKYKDFSIKLSDVAKYPGEIFIEYKYQISCPNWEGSGLPGCRIIYPAKAPFYLLGERLFSGFSFDIDNRYQFTKKELFNWLKEVADKVRYNKVVV